eukprot:185607_1
MDEHKKADFSDEYEDEALVHDTDEREPIHNTSARKMNIVNCIGQLTIEFRYNNNGLYYKKLLGTGTVISVIDSNSAMVLTVAHNVKTFVLECPKCQTYHNMKKTDINKNLTHICNHDNNGIVCNEKMSTKTHIKMINATDITFRRRSIQFGENVFGKLEGDPYPCKIEVLDDDNYKRFPGPNNGFDITILSFIDTTNYYKQFCADIIVKNIVDFDRFYLFGYPGEKEKRNKMYGSASTDKDWEYRIHSVTNMKYFRHREIDTTAGQSGAALWCQKDGKSVIFGIHSGGNSTSKYNIATLIKGDYIHHFSWLHKCWYAIKVSRDHISHFIQITEVSEDDFTISLNVFEAQEKHRKYAIKNVSIIDDELGTILVKKKEIFGDSVVAFVSNTLQEITVQDAKSDTKVCCNMLSVIKSPKNLDDNYKPNSVDPATIVKYEDVDDEKVYLYWNLPVGSFGKIQYKIILQNHDESKENDDFKEQIIDKLPYSISLNLLPAQIQIFTVSILSNMQKCISNSIDVYVDCENAEQKWDETLQYFMQITSVSDEDFCIRLSADTIDETKHRRFIIKEVRNDDKKSMKDQKIMVRKNKLYGEQIIDIDNEHDETYYLFLYDTKWMHNPV